ncbi:MAG TPA: ABC transporter ATP-binding protein [Desulfatiglandales bacterium]|nr:ABC transporter ATP-binding protein [Desulfatiglandales bacterium]
MKILEAERLSKHFGGLTAISGLNMEVEQGAILGLIGPNGAGKTTLFNLFSGALRADTGVVRFKGHDITGLKPHRIARRGLARTFQSVKIFSRMPVMDHVRLGYLFGRLDAGEKGEADREINEILEFVGLASLRDSRGGDLILANQKRLEVARALAGKPDLLLLDELMAGLTPTEIADAMELVKKIGRRGVTIVMIEHVMKAIMSICGRIIVLDHGLKIAEGTPEEIAQDKTVIEVYLGE